MIQSISSGNIAKKCIVGAMLIGTTYMAASAQNKKSETHPKTQQTEFLSTDASKILKEQFVGTRCSKTPDGNIGVYDSLDRLVKEFSLGENCYYTYSYYDNGNSKQDKRYDNNNNLEWTRVYFYSDAAGGGALKSEMTIYNDDDIIWVRYFDNEGYITRSIIKDGNGKTVQEYIYTPGPNGERIETILDENGNKVKN